MCMDFRNYVACILQNSQDASFSRDASFQHAVVLKSDCKRCFVLMQANSMPIADEILCSITVIEEVGGMNILLLRTYMDIMKIPN